MEIPADLIDLHNQLSGRLKEYEQHTGKSPPIEVLNELRYAFRAAIELHNSSDVEDGLLLQRIRHGLHCAYHDLVDGILIELSRQLDAAIENYPEATIRILGDKRMEILNDINRVEEKIAGSRQNPEKRMDVYEEIYDDFPVLAQHLRFFDQVALPDIIREADRLEVREAKARRNMYIGWAIGAIGLLLFIFSSS